MFSSDGLPNLPSPEFVTLCQAQSRLVQQGFQVDWCGVYLTRSRGVATTSQGEVEEPELIPIVVYPSSEATSYASSPLITLTRQQRDNPLTLPGLLLSVQDSVETWDSEEILPYSSGDHPQLVFPLVYQEVMLGVLVTGRESAPWQSEEVAQLENIARTLAIACFLDQQKSWYLTQLRQQQRRREWERDHLDDLFHQLRNPLTALRTFSKLLLKRFWGDDKTQGVIEGIGRESYHLQELLQAFEEDLARSDEEIVVPTWETETLPANVLAPVSAFLLPSSTLPLSSVDLGAVLGLILSSVEAIAQEKQIQLNTIISDNLSPIVGNTAALREIFSNLIDNALKYTPSEGKVRVTMGLISSTGTHQWQGVEIADTGYGIPQKDQDHIFERHYRGIQAEGDIPGTGLGLAIVKELVEKMRGKIEISSPNYLSLDSQYPGTTVTIWFLLDNQTMEVES
jgi:signal transduction histidine kinase